MAVGWDRGRYDRLVRYADPPASLAAEDREWAQRIAREHVAG